MAADISKSQHWGWRLENGQRVFSFGPSSSVPVMSELTQVFYITITGTRESDAQPSLAVKVKRKPFNAEGCEQQILYDATQHCYRFYICIRGIVLTEEELHSVMNQVANAVHARHK